jgi:hypothetical protein
MAVEKRGCRRGAVLAALLWEGGRLDGGTNSLAVIDHNLHGAELDLGGPRSRPQQAEEITATGEEATGVRLFIEAI